MPQKRTDNAPQKRTEKLKVEKPKVEKVKIEKARVVKPKSTEKAKLMISIVNRGDAIKLAEALSDEARLLHYTFLAKGTARSNILDYFGLTSAEKNIVVSVIPESMEKKLLTVAVETLKLYLVGKGIAFTVPLTSVSTLIANAVTADKAQQAKAEKQSKGEKKMNAVQYELIAAVYNEEFSDTVIQAARDAGAVGGTLVNARSLSAEAVEQFVGVNISHESQILLVLTKRESRNAIMQAIRDVAGLKTEGRAIVMSMPVDALVGIGTISDEYRKKNDEDVNEENKETEGA